MIHKALLTTMIEIRRHVTGAKRRRSSRTRDEAKINMGFIMDYRESQVVELQLKPDVTKHLCNITEKGPKLWRTLQRIPTDAECDEDKHKYDREFMGDYDKR